MSKKDIISIIAVAILGVVAAFVGVNTLLGDINDKSVTFNSIETISKDVGTPDPEVFNPDAINPTVEVYVGNCIDKNGNGILDEDELLGCSKVSQEEAEDKVVSEDGGQ